MSDNPTVRRGDRSDWVRYLQDCLVAAGFDVGPPGCDGIFGPLTEAAVRAFQEANGLEADAIVGSDTWDALEGGGGATSASAIDISYPVTLIPQVTPMSCWAAGMAMLLEYYGESKTQEEIAAECNLEHALEQGASSGELEACAAQLGFKLEGGACGGPDLLAGWLQEYGPIFVVDTANSGYHAVVVSGVRGDGTPEGTVVVEYNPWPPDTGLVHDEPFLEFQQEYEGGAGFTVYFVHK